MVNYRVVIQKEYYEDGTPVYTAECPTLHVYDYGTTIDKVLKSIQEGIELTLECMVEDGEEIPVDREDAIVVPTKISLPKDARLLAYV